MRSVAIITARWNSTRLPGKMLSDINGKPLLQWVVDRCRMSKVDDVVVATTPSSQPIIDYCEKVPNTHFVGDEEDILSRLYETAVVTKADLIIRVWGDCPCINPNIINRLINAWKPYDPYIYAPFEPKGTSAAITCFSHLAVNNQEIPLDRNDRHWYHNWCISHSWAKQLYSPYDLSGIDLSVDDEKSLQLVRSILV